MRYFIAAWLFIFTISSINAANKDYPELQQYVQKTVDEVSRILNSAASDAERIDKSKKLLAQNLQFGWMSKYTLGRHGKTLPANQLATFNEIYSAYMVKSFSDLVKNYKGEKINVKNVKNIDKDEYIVQTDVIKKNGQPSIKVDYLVHRMPDGNFKIGDIITEGVSMINSQKDEFNSILKDHDFDSLITELRKRTNNS